MPRFMSCHQQLQSRKQCLETCFCVGLANACLFDVYRARCSFSAQEVKLSLVTQLYKTCDDNVASNVHKFKAQV